METQIKFMVVGHHSREQQARALAYQIGPSAHVMIDPEDHGAVLLSGLPSKIVGW